MVRWLIESDIWIFVERGEHVQNLYQDQPPIYHSLDVKTYTTAGQLQVVLESLHC